MTTDGSPTLPAAEQEETLLEFPCRFPVKVMGRNEAEFVPLITAIIMNHAEIYADEAITTNSSGAGNYISVTLTIEAHSKAQLDRIYADLTACKQVLVAL